MLLLSIGLSIGLATEPRPVEVRVPNSWLRVRLELEGFEGVDDPALKSRLGAHGVLAGKLRRGDAALSLTAEPSAVETSSALRARAVRVDSRPAETFDVGPIACSERSSEIVSGLRQVEWHAHAVAFGHALDLGVSAVSNPGGTGFDRDGFLTIVRSLEIAWLRRGGFDDYPPTVIARMHTFGLEWSRGADRMEQASVVLARAGDEAFVAPYVLGEIAYGHGRDPTALRHLAQAVAALGEKKEHSQREVFVWATAEETYGLALARSGKLDGSIAHLERAREIARDLRPEIRAGIAYNLACSHGLVMDVDKVLEHLGEAIRIHPPYRDLAREDRDFNRVRDDVRFRDLVAKEH